MPRQKKAPSASRGQFREASKQKETHRPLAVETNKDSLATIFVVTGNAYPVKAFRTKASAQKLCDEKSADYNPNNPVVIWNVKPMTLED